MSEFVAPAPAVTNNTYYVQATAPGIATTLVITLFFGIFGLIPAASASSKAKALGQPTGKYWAAFAIPMGAYVLLMFLLIAAAGA